MAPSDVQLAQVGPVLLALEPVEPLDALEELEEPEELDDPASGVAADALLEALVLAEALLEVLLPEAVALAVDALVELVAVGELPRVDPLDRALPPPASWVSPAVPLLPHDETAPARHAATERARRKGRGARRAVIDGSWPRGRGAGGSMRPTYTRRPAVARVDLARPLRADAGTCGLAVGTRYWFRCRTRTREGLGD